MALRTALTLLATVLVATPLAAVLPSGSERDLGREEALGRFARGHFATRVWELGLDRDHDFVLKNVNQDATGEFDVRMHQTYQGVRVFAGEGILHVKEGEVREFTDALVRGLTLSTRPSIGDAEALASVHAVLDPRGAYAIAPTSELVIATVEVPNRFGRDIERTMLVYHVHTELENELDGIRHTDFFVDAHSGRVLEQWDSLHTADAAATGRSQFSGTVTLNTNSTATGFEMRDMTRGTGGTFGNNVVTNANHASTSSTATGSIYTNTTTTWGDGANYVEGSSTTAANGQTAAVDAMWGMMKSWDYYKLVQGRNGIDGTGKATYSRVHIGSGYDNAFWSDSCFCMTYGDGTSFLTLTAMDVAGHEMSHGVCATTAKLVYRGESGGLNEANSDIFGTLIEFYSRGGTGGNYTIGEQLATPSFNHPLRYMYKPSLDGASPDAWSSSLKRLDVHYSSGPANHFFFLLAHGSAKDALSGNIQSPMANGVTSITGIGNDLAGRIWFTALTKYMTSSTTYAGARTATLSACTFLGYPAGSTVYNTVNTAWLAVNVK
ncbi:MAG: M4 family metallopeptidase [Acidobacteria bacterium]|nr:M4 family metallopeptidase [Acidobacteriota bacterium]